MAARICFAVFIVAFSIVTMLAISFAGYGGGSGGWGQGTGVRPLAQAVPVAAHAVCTPIIDLGGPSGTKVERCPAARGGTVFRITSIDGRTWTVPSVMDPPR